MSQLRHLWNVTQLTSRCVNETSLGNLEFQFSALLDQVMSLTSLPVEPLRMSVFNCSALSNCTVACRPPSDAVLRESHLCLIVISSLSFRTTCDVEWMIHSRAVGFVLALGVWVALNASRVLLVKSYMYSRSRSLGLQEIRYTSHGLLS